MHDTVTNENVQKLLVVKQTRAYAIIREMVSAGYIQKSGDNKASYTKS